METGKKWWWPTTCHIVGMACGYNNDDDRVEMMVWWASTIVQEKSLIYLSPRVSLFLVTYTLYFIYWGGCAQVSKNSDVTLERAGGFGVNFPIKIFRFLKLALKKCVCLLCTLSMLKCLSMWINLDFYLDFLYIYSVPRHLFVSTKNWFIY